MDVPLAEDREFAMLDRDQINTLNALERMGATLSLLGILLIFITFAMFKRLRNVPNTFIFFASIANVGACVACLIAYDGIEAMNRDRSSPLCQAQGFLFEWFMQSDTWWSFAMAINVFLVFFRSYNPTTFRHYLWVYCLICYGLPATPSFVFLFIRQPKGLVYGDAVLWCWVSSEWNYLRIYSYYLPIWVCSVLSAVIYFAVGYHVFHQRNQLRNLSLSNQGKDVAGDFSDMRDSAEKDLAFPPTQGYYGTVTTEIQVDSATIPTSAMPIYRNPFQETSNSRSNIPIERQTDSPSFDTTTNTTVTSVTGENSYDFARPTTPGANTPAALAPVHSHNYPWSREPTSPLSPGTNVEPAVANPANSKATLNYPAAPPRSQADNFEITNHAFNTAQYTSISVGSIQDRDDRGPSPTRLMSTSTRKSTAAFSDAPRRKSAGAIKKARGNVFSRMPKVMRRFGAKLRKMDPVKLAYLRTSFVFAISVLVTWTPSSINRVYTLIYPDRASYGLNIAAAVVLPLQGVWNAVIYFTTSWRLFREEMESTTLGSRLLRWLGLNDETQRSGGGSFALGSSSRTARSEMGRSKRLQDGESHDGDDMEMQSPMSSPRRPQAPFRMSTMRVTQKGLEDFS